jgi:hypothetical protein
MKLLLDQNLPRQLAGALQASFPGTSHVWPLGLAEASDDDVWEYAAKHWYFRRQRRQEETLPFVFLAGFCSNRLDFYVVLRRR